MITQTRSGKVEGYEEDGVAVFKGIPYAAPPIGTRRWMAPEREDAWDDVRDATAFSPQSAQGAFAMNAMLGGPEPVVSEDSLYLNVWTPACDDAKRPVMVWIHGGAFVFGSGDTPWYDGTAFAKQGDVVVVTLNYRLGAFGFLHLADLFGAEFEGSGNAGILDQAAALEWVRDSIAAFGGDPENVTVFGESAGGGSVGTLLGMPAARGLFNKAIPQSGASSWWATRERGDRDRAGVHRQARRQGRRHRHAAGRCRRTRSSPGRPASGACRRVLMPSPSSRSSTAPRCPSRRSTRSRPGTRRVCTCSSAPTGTRPRSSTSWTRASQNIDEAGIATRVGPWYGADASALVASYRSRRADETNLELWTDIGSDAVFRIPAIRLAETQLAHGPVWMYLFTWETPVFGGILKACHALEIPFVFDTLANAAMFTGDAAERQGIADAMHAAWIAFARTGDPNVAALPEWPAYDTQRRATMRFDVTPEILDDPMSDDRSLGEFRR